MNSIPLFILLFGISGGEILVILLLILILFGPKKIPEIARTIGKGINEIKKVQRDINAEIHRYSDEIENPAKEIRKDIEGFRKGLNQQDDKKGSYPDPAASEGGLADPKSGVMPADNLAQQDDELPYPYNQIEEEAQDEPPLENDEKQKKNENLDKRKNDV
ncbi:MAG: Sec-independent protein translocase subunit TatA/TatB [Bacteroidota bacterium]